jgi:hypothetical protein
MGQIKYIGKCFSTVEAFLEFMFSYRMGAWRPAYITMHHTGSPDLKTWEGYSKRARPISDEQWLANLASYYGSPQYDQRGRLIKSAWLSGPQFFFTPKNFCVLSPPERPGVHAASFNHNSWGVECVGNFDGPDKARFTGELKQRYVDGLAALHLVMGLQPGGYVRGKSGLHFHRDDPKTTKTCPGTGVSKPDMVKLITTSIGVLSGRPDPKDKGLDHEMDKVVPVKNPEVGVGFVKGLKGDDALNVRASASAKSPVLSQLRNSDKVAVVGQAKNGTTLWYEIDIPGDANGFVSALYVDLS